MHLGGEAAFPLEASVLIVSNGGPPAGEAAWVAPGVPSGLMPNPHLFPLPDAPGSMLQPCPPASIFNALHAPESLGFLRDSFPGGVVDLGDPTHRERKNHMDRSILCRRGLVNLISQEHSWLL